MLDAGARVWWACCPLLPLGNHRRRMFSSSFLIAYLLACSADKNACLQPLEPCHAALALRTSDHLYFISHYS